MPVEQKAARTPVASAPVLQPVYLTWEYGSSSNVVFEVWRAPMPQGHYSLWTNTTDTEVRLSQSGFYLVRASNTVSQLVSGWPAKIASAVP